MKLDDTTTELTMREKMALRVLAIMYRLISPHEHSFKTDEDLAFILTGKEKK
jgi:hypothetical protein